MFKKMSESARTAVVFQKSLDTRMAYSGIVVLSVQKYFNQNGDQFVNQRISGTTTSGRNKISVS
jgi:hypothetical protein